MKMTPVMFFCAVYEMMKLRDECYDMVRVMAEEHRDYTEEEKQKAIKLYKMEKRVREELISVDEKTGKPKYEIARSMVKKEFFDILGLEPVTTNK